MNENESRREIRMSKKILISLDQRIEEIISNERLTGADKFVDAAVSQNNELLVLLSQERRNLLRLISKQESRFFKE